MLHSNKDYEVNKVVKFPDSQLDIEFICYDSVENIDPELWDPLARDHSIYSSRKYLKSVEEGMKTDFEFRYVLFLEDGLPIGISLYQILESRSELLSRFNSKYLAWFDFVKLKYLINGSVFYSGHEGFYFKKEGIEINEVVNLVSNVSKFILNKEKRRRSVNVIVVKEFTDFQRIDESNINDYKYYKFHLEPNMVLNLKAEWNTYDDYLGAMNKKFRSKSKVTDKKSIQIRSKCLSSNEILEQGQIIHKLYKNVYDRAEFKLGLMSLEMVAKLKENLGDKYVFKAYFLEEKIVAFATAFVYDERLDANYIGIDYELNREHSLYHRILYDYVRLGFEHKTKQVSFGRTASEIKSRLGAIPLESVSYVHLRNPLAHSIFGRFVSRIKPKSFDQRNPFKA